MKRITKKQQAQWRKNMFYYIMRTTEFKEDLMKGAINLDDWGIVAKVIGNNAYIYLAEDTKKHIAKMS
jgi:leucyl aminopeptidase (aminopeptidase T)